MFKVKFFKRKADVTHNGKLIGLIVYLAKCKQHFAYNLNLDGQDWHFCDTFEQAITEVKQIDADYDIILFVNKKPPKSL